MRRFGVGCRGDLVPRLQYNGVVGVREERLSVLGEEE